LPVRGPAARGARDRGVRALARARGSGRRTGRPMVAPPRPSAVRPARSWRRSR